jgi:pyrroline-5-carboxylate reductase
MNKSIGFIGGGRITRILLKALKNRNLELNNVMVYDVNRETCKKLNQDFPAIRITDLNSAATRDIVFIALHPPVIIETLNLVKKIIRQETIFISLAPKITISNIAGSLANKNIVRFMPNATSIINKGYNPVCFNNGFRDKQATLDLLSLLGKAGMPSIPSLEKMSLL